MQAVILASGRGVRMKSLTESTPKPMLQVGGKNLIEHKLLVLPPTVKEIIIVVGYLGHQIRDFFGDSYGGRWIHYVEQSNLTGTAHALWQARELLRDRFVVLNGDDLYAASDLAAGLKHEWAILAKKMEEPAVGARVDVDAGGKLIAITEGVDLVPGDLFNAGMYVLTTDIFNYEPVQIPGREEWGLPQTIVQAASRRPIGVVEATRWLPITCPADLSEAELFLKP